jgi:pimeloyl-ACP methyl ester carboxylesterase
MTILTRDGVDIYYEIHGAGPVVLLTHGFSATSQMWRGQIEPLAQRYKVIVWDMRGHGQSAYPADQSLYSEADTVADMNALLDVAKADRAIVGGLSLGGYMSLAYNLKHPERVAALLIIDTGPGFKSDGPREAWNANALKTAARFESEGLASLQSRSAEMRTSRHRSAEGLARAARGMLTQRDARVINSLPDIKVPSLVIVGAKDEPFLNAADYMAAKIPRARKVVVPDAGHAANIDQPEAFNQAVMTFLDSLALARA